MRKRSQFNKKVINLLVIYIFEVSKQVQTRVGFRRNDFGRNVLTRMICAEYTILQRIYSRTEEGSSQKSTQHVPSLNKSKAISGCGMGPVILIIFFRNSIFFMCFWFGLEILRLVYKRAFFLNIERFLSYLTFYPQKKTATPLIRVEKKFLQNSPQRAQKEAEICTDFKSVLSLGKGKKGRKTYLLGI
jgi:hypothetical protein